jgi:PAS domain S-box-containing protein
MATTPDLPAARSDPPHDHRAGHAQALFEGIDDAVFVHDLDGRILDLNGAACRRLGYTRDELLRMKTSDIDDPQFATGFEDRLQAQMTQGRLSCEGCHITKDGRRIPVDINTSVIEIDGKPAVLAVMRDISARKAAEQRMAAQHAFTRVLAESANLDEAAPRALQELGERLGWDVGALWLADNGASRLRCHAVWHRTLPQAAELADATRPLAFALGEGIAGRVWRTGEPIWIPDIAQIETLPRAVIAGRTGILQAYAFPVHSGGVVLGVIDFLARNMPQPDNDLAAMSGSLGSQLGQFIERRRAEDAQRQMQTMLARSEKLASIGLLSAGVAHEINNPLAYVANNLVVLERDCKGLRELLDVYQSAQARLAEVAPDAARRAEEIIEQIDLPYIRDNIDRIITRTREGVERMARIVQGLRSLARTDRLRFEDARLADLIDSSLEMVRGRLRRAGIEVVLNLEPLPSLRCVATQVGQVLLNLIVNAAQAIEAGPTARPGRIAISARKAGSEVCIDIADNGCGIDPRELPHIFDPFYTSKPAGEGTGLGLSLSHNIVTGHGGRITVDSDLGAGTCFHIFLPLQSNLSLPAATRSHGQA